MDKLSRTSLETSILRLTLLNLLRDDHCSSRTGVAPLLNLIEDEHCSSQTKSSVFVNLAADNHCFGSLC